MERIMEYLSIKQISTKWNLSTRRILTLCKEGRIPDAVKIGYYWVIPKNAKKPKDGRVKSEKIRRKRILNDNSLGTA
jgi:hypothetical protein